MSAKDQSRLHQFGEKVLPGIFIRYALWFWNGDCGCRHCEELENLDASEIHAQRLDAKGVLMPKDGENFTFPIAEGTVNLSVRGQAFLKFTPTRSQ